ncbi:hypothetical protein CRG98_043710 [Punica granatum]|uniref:Uncharacterized protein n=1 Tax=Punica granatum TaxID=22663 RepID=A0A2I0HWK8_PUNGR|nr:hypothetical protein CRG98_043710 [Punica granatum]
MGPTMSPLSYVNLQRRKEEADRSLRPRAKPHPLPPRLERERGELGQRHRTSDKDRGVRRERERETEVDPHAPTDNVDALIAAAGPVLDVDRGLTGARLLKLQSLCGLPYVCSTNYSPFHWYEDSVIRKEKIYFVLMNWGL